MADGIALLMRHTLTCIRGSNPLLSDRQTKIYSHTHLWCHIFFSIQTFIYFFLTFKSFVKFDHPVCQTLTQSILPPISRNQSFAFIFYDGTEGVRATFHQKEMYF